MQSGQVKRVETTPFEGQKPGTSGLRKKVCLSRLFNFIIKYFLHELCILEAGSVALEHSCTLFLQSNFPCFDFVNSRIVFRCFAFARLLDRCLKLQLFQSDLFSIKPIRLLRASNF